MEDYIKVSGKAGLIMVARCMNQMNIWKSIEGNVRIKQKAINDKPLDKVKDAFINILAGGTGMAEINSRVRTDPALSLAFGRSRCAEQSVVSETFNACGPEQVEQMRKAVAAIYRQYGQGMKHAYEQSYQLLDIDMTGLPAGRQSEGSEKGYFPEQKYRRGRQLGRVVATHYDEIVTERLYDGKVQLERSLQSLILAAEEVLELDVPQRRRTIIRCDGGGGRDEDINWLLEREYALLFKVKNWQRACKLARSVSDWVQDPKVAQRQAGWVQMPHAYESATRQLAIRHLKKDGKLSQRVLVFNLSDEALFFLAKRPLPAAVTDADRLLAALVAYDLRGGGVETSFKGSKQGLGITRRNKKKFTSQEMLILLAQLAANLITWVRNTLAAVQPRLRSWGMLRMVRDAFSIRGQVVIDPHGRFKEISLNSSDWLAQVFLDALSRFLNKDDTYVILAEI